MSTSTLRICRCSPYPVRTNALRHLALFLVLLLVPAAQAQDSTPHIFSKYNQQARELIRKMTLDEKIGQMLQPDQKFLKSVADIQKYHFGSLLSGGDSDPKAGNSLKAWTDLYEGYQALACTFRCSMASIQFMATTM